MKNIIIIILFFLFVSPLYGAHIHATGSSQTIAVADHSADLWDTLIVDNDITVDDTWLSFGTTSPNSCKYWIVDLNGKTIRFGNNGGTGEKGIIINSVANRAHDITIRNGTIIAPQAAGGDCDSNSVRNMTCIVMSGHRIKLDSVNLIADGYNGKCFYNDNTTAYDVEINGGSWKSRVNCFGSRSLFDAAGIYFYSDWNPTLASDSGFSWNISIIGLRIDSTPHAAILCHYKTSGYGIKLNIHHDTLLVDCRDSSDNRTANGFAMELTYMADGSRIYNNIITSGQSFMGGSGIHVNGRYSLAGWIYVGNNNINMSRGDDAEFSTGHPCSGISLEGYRTRDSIINNTVLIYCDNDAGTAYRSLTAEPLTITYNGAATTASDTTHDVIVGNSFRAHASGSSRSSCFAVALSVYGLPYKDTHTIIERNRFESNQYPIGLNFADSKASGMIIYDDTLVFNADSSGTGTCTFKMGMKGGEPVDTGWVFQDCTYLNGTSPTNIGVLADDAGLQSATIKKTVQCKIVRPDGSPMYNVGISGTNNYSQSIYSQNSNSSGITNQVVTYFYKSNLGDSSSFNNMSFIAAAQNADTNAITVAWNLGQQTFNLNGLDSLKWIVHPFLNSSAGIAGFYSNQHPQGIPRNSLGCTKDSGEVIAGLYNNGSASKASLFRTFNDGLTWDDSLRLSTPYMSNHSWMIMDNDTLWGGASAEVIDYIYPRVVSASGAALSLVNGTGVHFESDGADRVRTDIFIKLPGSDSSFCIMRDRDAYGDNTKYVISTNRWAGFETPAYLENYGFETRIGAMIFDNTIYATILYRPGGSDSAIYLFHWDRAAKNWVKDTKAIVRDSTGINTYRMFSIMTQGDTAIHIFALVGDVAGTYDRIKDIYRNKSATNWTKRDLKVMSYDAADCGISATLAQRSNRLVAFYSETTDGTNYKLRAKFLADGAADWSPEILLSNDTTIMKEITGAELVPSSHGDRVYCLWNDNAHNLFGILQFYENQIPASASSKKVKGILR
jgi:hypothetical protein